MLAPAKVRALARASPLLFAARAPTVFCDQLSDRINFHGQPCNHAIFACALGLELFQPREIAGFEPGISIAPLSNRIGVKAMSSGELGSGRAGVKLFENRDDLCLGEATFLHVSSPWAVARNSQFQPEPFSHLRSIPKRLIAANACTRCYLNAALPTWARSVASADAFALCKHANVSKVTNDSQLYF